MTKLLAIRLKPNEDLKQSLKNFAIQLPPRLIVIKNLFSPNI
jgi:hypothetical protein